MKFAKEQGVLPVTRLLEETQKARAAGIAVPKPTASAAPPIAKLPAVLGPSYKSAPRPNDFAVVVGIEKYSERPKASFAERDAQAVVEHMLSLGIPRRNVIHLSGQKAGRSAIVKYLSGGVGIVSRGRKHPLPAPFLGGVGVLARDGAGEGDAAEPFAKVLHVLCPNFLQMLLKGSYGGVRQHSSNRSPAP